MMSLCYPGVGVFMARVVK